MEQPATARRDGVGRQTRRAPGPVAGVPVPEGYELGPELGRGAGTVVLHVRRDGRDLAYKLTDVAAGDPRRALAALRREAALIAAIDHPGVPRILEAGLVEGRPYLVMDLVEGHHLGRALLGGRLDAGATTRVGLDVAGALGAAHRVGLVHRDLKPQNLMVTADGTTRLIDYGLATREERPPDEELAVGTLAYAPPEQTGMLRRPVDARSDLYSLGVVLYECLAGHLPFPDDGDVGELLRMHATDPPPDLLGLGLGVPPRLAAVVHRMLAKDPDDRYQRAEDVVQDLGRVAADLGWAAGETQGAGEAADLPGRGEQTTALLARWREAHEGRPGAVVLRGPAGIGTSRLGHHVGDRVAAEGILVLRGDSSRDDHVPLGPLRRAVEAHLDDLARTPDAEREAAGRRLQVAAGAGAPLLAALSPRLAEVLGVPDVASGEDAGPFAVAVADFLLALAGSGDGLLLVLDDVHRLDPATVRVLERIALDPGSAPLLLLATARDDEPADREAIERLRAALGGFADVELILPPLDVAAVAGLVRETMPGLGEVPGLAEVLAGRSHGNPFVALEYLRAVVDAGLLLPEWGRWRMDAEDLAALDLPEDALGLVLARVDRLGERSREVLSAAAVVGRAFPVPLLSAVTRTPIGELQGLLAEAFAARLLVLETDGSYAFVHERVREGLVAGLDPEVRRELHLATAVVLEQQPDTPAVRYARAEHHMAAAPPRFEAERLAAVGAAHAAGVAALEDHASEQALALFEFAAGLLEPRERPAVLLTDLGTAARRCRRFALAVEAFGAALEREESPLARAEILDALARVHTANWRPTLARQAVQDGLRALGFRVPRTRLGLALRLLVGVGAGLVVGLTGLRRGKVRGERRERYRRAVRLRETASYAAVLDLEPPRMVAEALSALYMVNRLGPGPEYTRVYAVLAQVCRVVGLEALGDALHRRSAAAARALGDPRLVADTEVAHAAAGYLGRRADMDSWVRAYEQYGRWLEPGIAADTIGAAFNQESMRGRTRAARVWAGRARPTAGTIEIDSAMMLPGSAEVLCGQFAAAAAEFRAVAEAVGPERERGLRMMFALTGAYTLLEQREYGRPMDDLLAAVDDLGVSPRRAIRPYVSLNVIIARLQLGRLRHARPEERDSQEKVARAAVARFAKLADAPLFRANLRLLEAELAELRGKPEDALHELDRVGVLEPDAPLVAFDTALLRARAHTALGHGGQARREAATAALIASEQDWPHRARWVVEEFPGVRGATHRPGGSARPTTTATTVMPGLERLRLQALQDVSRAASRELDPARLSRIVLDRTISILAAERAFLFLTEGPDDRLVPYVGRDAAGNEIPTPTAYGTTLVERVRTTRTSLVVTGTDQGAALGSESVVLHGLRSILVAPLLLEDRLLGVVYLDSQVAKGIFTENDEGILVAITTHVATALETARAAQLQVGVEAARRQQELAEQLGEALRDMTGTLDPDDVLTRLLSSASRIFPQAEVSLVLAGPDPTSTPTPTPSDDDDGASLVVPLVPAHGDPVGHLVLRGADLGPAELEVAGTLAAQGVAAHANALLYARVQQLSVVDELTGIANRRRLFDQAGLELAAARRYEAPLTAVMVDIDHFKRVNDTFGHGTGDDVIREVAARLRDAVRGTDLVGRYGGEEFGLVLTDADDPLTAGRRLLAAVTLAPVETRSGPLAVTVSVGVARLSPDDDDVANLFGRADEALYRAKQNGRNQVSVAE